MGSENAKQVAKDVITTVRNGKIVNKQEIQQKNGYSESSARAMKATRTQSYKKELEPFVNELIKERDRCIKALKTKDLDKVAYEKLNDAIDKQTKNIQLLSGGDTERARIIVLPQEIIENNEITSGTIQDSKEQETV